MNNGQSLAWLGMFRVYRCVWGPIPPGSTRLNYKQPWWEPLWTHQDLRTCKCYNGFSWIFEHCSHSETPQLLDNSVWWSHHGRDKSFVPRPRQRHQTVRTCREHSSLGHCGIDFSGNWAAPPESSVATRLCQPGTPSGKRAEWETRLRSSRKIGLE